MDFIELVSVGPTTELVPFHFGRLEKVPELFFVFKRFYLFIYLFEREREREAETQAEGEADSMQGA